MANDSFLELAEEASKKFNNMQKPRGSMIIVDDVEVDHFSYRMCAEYGDLYSKFHQVGDIEGNNLKCSKCGSLRIKRVLDNGDEVFFEGRSTDRYEGYVYTNVKPDDRSKKLLSSGGEYETGLCSFDDKKYGVPGGANKMTDRGCVIKAGILVVIAGIIRFLIYANHTSIVIATGVKVFRGLQIASTSLLYITWGIMVLCAIRLVRSYRKRTADGRRINKKREEVKSDPINRLIYDIDQYLENNNSTEFFRNSFSTIRNQIPRIKKQVDGVVKVASDRFGEDSLSYGQFVQPVMYLLEHIVKLGEDLLQRMDMFDEENYQQKIDRINGGYNSDGSITDYKEVMDSYVGYTKAILGSIEETTVKLDKLIIEIGKLSNDDLLRSMTALHELDSIIVNTKLYRN